MNKRYNLPSVAALALVATFPVHSDNLYEINGYVTGMSPDATHVVGIKSPWDEARFTSFVYTPATGSLEWKTDGENYTGSHLDGGYFTAMNNTGIIAGMVRNPDMRLPAGGGGDFFAPSTRNQSDDTDGEAILSGAVWRNGKLYVLGTGPHDIGDFSDSNDGSVVTGISADGNTVFGNIVQSWFIAESCVWIYDPATDTYEFQPLAFPRNCQMSELTAVSANGFPAVGRTSLRDAGSEDSFMSAAVWYAPDDPFRIAIPDESEYAESTASAISADGLLVAVSASGTDPYLGIFNNESGQLKPIALPSDVFSVNVMSITNDGNMIMSVRTRSWNTELRYYDNTSGAIVSFDTYLSEALPDMGDANIAGNSSVIVSVSGDGRNILLRPDSYSNTAWLIEIDNPALATAPAPADVRLYHTSPSSLEVSFDGIASIPESCTLTGYKVYVDGIERATIETSAAGGTYTATADGTAGQNHIAYVVTTFTKNGADLTSGRSPQASCYISADTSLLGVCDFEDSYVDEQGNIIWTGDTWQSVPEYGSQSELIYWHITCEDFENRTPYAATYSIATRPWSTTYVSHFMDATGHDDFYLDMRYKMRLVNSATQNLSSDYFDVEASTDGKNWTTLLSICAADVNPGYWNNLRIDLGKEWSGKVFQLRINTHGEGIGNLCWNLDDIVIADSFDAAPPAGLRFTVQDSRVLLTWRNSMGLYDLSYLANSGILWSYNVGGAGAPFIGAIDLTPDRLEPFTGEYINAVSTFLFDDPSLPQPDPTKAEAIVYADGVEVARAGFDASFDSVDQATAWLDTPVLIEKGKTYRIGVRIYDYIPQQAPMYYQNSPDFIAGVTDLYSEDEGVTWHNASEAVATNANPNGYCVWPIRAHIDTTPVNRPGDMPDSDLMYYNVFRNGQLISTGNIYEPHPRFIDDAPLSSASYTVEAHYKGGLISPMSAPIDVDLASVHETSFTLAVTTGAGYIDITGDCLGATLIDMNGRTVSRTDASRIDGIAPGIYLLMAKTANGNETYKVVVK